MEIGIVGLGRMGGGIARRLMRDGHKCVVYDRSAAAVEALSAEGAKGATALADIVRATYYLTDVKDAEAHFAVCGEVLGEIRPAATLLIVAGLYKPEMKVEIEVTAKRRT